MDEEKVGFWKRFGMYIGIASGTLAIMLSWQSLEFLPRWAWYTEVLEVQQFSETTRKIVLNQEWFRISTQLKQARVELSANPRDRNAIEEVTRLEQQLRTVEQQINELNTRQSYGRN